MQFIHVVSLQVVDLLVLALPKIQLKSTITVSRFLFVLQIIVHKYTTMHDLQQSSSQRLLSPTAFILDLADLSNLPPLHLTLPESDPQELIQKYSPDEAAQTNSRDQKKRLAGVRSRERKKKYVEDLEEKVKKLSVEVEKYQTEISNCKDELLEAIRTANSQANQHAYTYSELERQAHSEDPDIDSINHLLDVLQSRIGANAKQRQTKLDYYFKQITNSLFPAIHRYMMYCAQKNEDVFAQNVSTESLQGSQSWTKQLYLKLKLSPQQIKGYCRYKQQFRSKRNESSECIRKLRVIRDEMKRQQQVFERGMYEFRLDLDPVQSALIAVFGEKNKLRREFCLGQQFEDQPRKKVKTEQ